LNLAAVIRAVPQPRARVAAPDVQIVGERGIPALVIDGGDTVSV
jgi:hypothetical protein